MANLEGDEEIDLVNMFQRLASFEPSESRWDQSWEQSGNVVSFTGDDLAADVLRNEILDDLGFEYDQGGYYQHNFSDFEPSTDDEYDFFYDFH